MIEYNVLKKRIDDTILNYRDELTELNDYIADHPEISGEEYETSKKIVELLRNKGFEVESPFANYDTAFKGIYGKNNHTHKIAILTEYDALPEIGHACGHCLSGCISILASLALIELQDELDSDIHIIGTPVEETDGAKCGMIRDGVFDEYELASMVHLYDENLSSVTLVGLQSYMYEFKGKPAHAAGSPWEGCNALNAAQLMFHAVDMLRQHVTPDIRIHGIIKHGGDAPNIVPEYASAEFYVRGLDEKILDDVVRKVDDCAKGAAIATQTTWSKYKTAETYSTMKNNKFGTEKLEEVFEELGIILDHNADNNFGSSDAGNVSFVCPTFHPCVQAVEKGIKIHTHEFAIGMKSEMAHEALVIGAKLISYHIAKIFSNEDNIKKISQTNNKND